MHIPDGFLSNGVAGGLIGVAALALGVVTQFVRKQYFNSKVILQKKLALEGGLSISSGFSLSREFKKKVRPRILKAAVFGALVFSLQMLNFPIFEGTSGHFLGGALLALVIGPFEGLLVISLVLIIQSLVFADGGILALGANIFNMGIIGTVFSFYFFRFVWKRISHLKKNYFALVFGVAWFSVVLASLFCAAEIYFSGSAGANIFSAMLFYHVLIGIFEGFITVLVLYYLSKKTNLPFLKSVEKNEE